MSIHGLLQEPASYPADFITLPFTIPPPPSFGSQVFKSSRRSITSTGGVPTMTAGQALQDTIFDFVKATIEFCLAKKKIIIFLSEKYDEN
jgi:hypothetical protein